MSVLFEALFPYKKNGMKMQIKSSSSSSGNEQGATCSRNNGVHPVSDIKTLADLDRWLADCADMPSNRRYERRAAVRVVGKWFEEQSDRISTDPNELRARFERLSPGALRVTRKRISNVKSALLAAIRAAGILPKYKYVDIFLSEWMPIWEKLSIPEKRQLSRLIRYCSAQGVRPERFDDAVGQACVRDWILFQDVPSVSPNIEKHCACRRKPFYPHFGMNWMHF